MNFASLGLSEPLLKAVEKSGYTTPTPIQQQAIPVILKGRDVMAAAQTGTGKTAGFTLPLLQRLARKESGKRQVRALVLTPTRELAAQVQACIETYGAFSGLRSLPVFGGVNINPQIKALQGGVDILVATPGRLLDLHQQKAVSFEALEILVLDEADRMLDMGFIHDIRRILKLLPAKRQNLMFSATFSDDIRELARRICSLPEEIDVSPRNSTVATISQQLYMVPKEDKVALLASLLQATPEQVLVFSRTKHGANALVKKLARFGVQSAAIHGNKSQAQRVRALDAFKNDQIQVLIATDIAARGIDIHQLAMVINFDLPQVPEDYVHRIGRTGRAGAGGQAVSLVTADESKQLKAIERLIKNKIERLDYDAAALPEPQSGEVEPAQLAPARKQAGGNAEATDKAPRKRRSRRRKPAEARRGDGGANTDRGRGRQSSREAADGQAPASGNSGRRASSGNRQGAQAGNSAGQGQRRRRRGGKGGNRRPEDKDQVAARTADGGQKPGGGRRAGGRDKRPAAATEAHRQGVWGSLKSLFSPT